jgi:peptide/nickel transport system permease protein
MPEMQPSTPLAGETAFAPVPTLPEQQTPPRTPRVEREFTVRERTQTEQVVRRFMQHRAATVSLAVFLLMVLFGFLTPLFWHYTYDQITPEFNTPPTGQHPFGTDLTGHDGLAITTRGLQHSLMISFMLTGIAMIAGVALGAVAGFYRGAVDAVIMRFCDLMLTIPVIAIAAALGASTGGTWWMIGLILGVLAIWYVARLVRGVVLSLREKEFIEASRALGASDWRIMVRHLVPNAMGPVLVLATISVAAGVLGETALSSIGFGVQSPDTSLGLQIQQAVTGFSSRPWQFYIPGVFVILIALTINFIGDGLRDAFDPRQTRVRQ